MHKDEQLPFKIQEKPLPGRVRKVEGGYMCAGCKQTVRHVFDVCECPEWINFTDGMKEFVKGIDKLLTETKQFVEDINEKL